MESDKKARKDTIQCPNFSEHVINVEKKLAAMKNMRSWPC